MVNIQSCYLSIHCIVIECKIGSVFLKEYTCKNSTLCIVRKKFIMRMHRCCTLKIISRDGMNILTGALHRMTKRKAVRGN